jgi:hypothetical protein
VVVIGQQPRGESKLDNRDVLQGLGLGIERAQNFPSGGIALRMQDAVAAVRAFAAEDELGAVAIKMRAPGD